MNRVNTHWQELLLRLLFITFLVMMVENTLATPYIKADTSDTFSAVEALLFEAYEYYKNEQFEQAAASLERALRIEPRHPRLWYNLAGVRLEQGDWKRAANLAQKSNALIGNNDTYKKLRIRNWVIITLACKGMGDEACERKARDRAQALVRALN
jgi:tetratricopeptide (TPR) repeat protein